MDKVFRLFTKKTAKDHHDTEMGRSRVAASNYVSLEETPATPVAISLPPKQQKPQKDFSRHTAGSKINVPDQFRLSIERAVMVQYKKVLVEEELVALAKCENQKAFQNAKTRRHVLNELLATEETYVNFLHFIEDFLMQGCKDPLSNPILSNTDMKIVFPGIETIIQAHSLYILPELRHIINTPVCAMPSNNSFIGNNSNKRASSTTVSFSNDLEVRTSLSSATTTTTTTQTPTIIARAVPIAVAKHQQQQQQQHQHLSAGGQSAGTRMVSFDSNNISSNNNNGDKMSEIGAGVGQFFVMYADVFKLYGEYINGLPGSRSRISQLMTTNHKFAQLVSDSRRDARSHNLNLDALLVKPFQRVLKYPLLLSELLSHTPDGPERVVLSKALEMMRLVVRDVNERARDSERRQRVLDVQIKLDNAVPALVQPGRFLVAEGNFIEVREGKLGNRLGVTIYLLSDLLILHKLRKLSLTRGRVDVFDTRDIMVRVIPDQPGLHHLFGVASVEDPSAEIILSAASQADVISWLEHFRSIGCEVSSSATSLTRIFPAHWRNPGTFQYILWAGLLRPHALWGLPLLCLVHGANVFLPVYAMLYVCMGIPMALTEVGIGQLGQGSGFAGIRYSCGKRWRGIGYLTATAAMFDGTLCVYWVAVTLSWAISCFITHPASSSASSSAVVSPSLYSGFFIEKLPATYQGAVSLFVVWMLMCVVLVRRLRQDFYRVMVLSLVLCVGGTVVLSFVGLSQQSERSAVRMFESDETSWSQLLSFGVWTDALVQVVLTLNLGSGMLVSMGSHVPRQFGNSMTQVVTSMTYAAATHLVFLVLVFSFLPPTPTSSSTSTTTTTTTTTTASSSPLSSPHSLESALSLLASIPSQLSASQTIIFMIVLLTSAVSSALPVLNCVVESSVEICRSPTRRRRITLAVSLIGFVMGMGLAVVFDLVLPLLLAFTQLVVIVLECCALVCFTPKLSFSGLFLCLAHYRMQETQQITTRVWNVLARFLALPLSTSTLVLYVVKMSTTKTLTGSTHSKSIFFEFATLSNPSVVAGGLGWCVTIALVIATLTILAYSGTSSLCCFPFRSAKRTKRQGTRNSLQGPMLAGESSKILLRNNTTDDTTSDDNDDDNDTPDAHSSSINDIVLASKYEQGTVVRSGTKVKLLQSSLATPRRNGGGNMNVFAAIQGLTVENSELKRENAELKERLRKYESEPELWGA